MLAPFLVEHGYAFLYPFRRRRGSSASQGWKVRLHVPETSSGCHFSVHFEFPYILCMANNGNGTERGFHVFATQAAYWVGTKWAFLLALLSIVVWLVSGSYFHYSDTWPPLLGRNKQIPFRYCSLGTCQSPKRLDRLSFSWAATWRVVVDRDRRSEQTGVTKQPAQGQCRSNF